MYHPAQPNLPSKEDLLGAPADSNAHKEVSALVHLLQKSKTTAQTAADDKKKLSAFDVQVLKKVEQNTLERSERSDNTPLMPQKRSIMNILIQQYKSRQNSGKTGRKIKGSMFSNLGFDGAHDGTLTPNMIRQWPSASILALADIGKRLITMVSSRLT